MFPELTRDNPRLLELESAYANLSLFPQSLWRTFSDSIDVTRFRGEPGYLAQLWGGMREERYRNSYDYARTVARDVCKAIGYADDDAFGVVGFPTGSNGYITRDFTDSALEISFLQDTLGLIGIDRPALLDIGAGYGMLAVRWKQAMPFASVDCVDAVPLSTFLCNFYLKYRECDRAYSVPLMNLDTIENVDIACNMYSFSEMPLAAVQFWLSFCADLNVKYFFLVPHAGDLVHPHYVTSEPDGTHGDYYAEFARYGYRETCREWKFPEAESARYIYNTQHILFQRG